MIIAIDGPAGSGKSTTAKWVARKLGYLYLDTGAMYRTIALALIRANQTPQEDTIVDFLNQIYVDFVPTGEQTRVFLNQDDVTAEIRNPDVSKMASDVAKLAVVRDEMVRLQRKIGYKEVEENGGVVLDGRDIGTVVFPDAPLKIFLLAHIEARAQRRMRELQDANIETTLEALIAEIEARDDQDSSREHAPLRKADDAIALDTTHLSIEEQVDFVVAKAQSLKSKLK